MKKIVLLSLIILVSLQVEAQRKKRSTSTTNIQWTDTISMDSLSFRAIGPALTSGRISDFAMHPTSPKVYYVATSSGGVWKTSNAGTTFKPIFDEEGSYSIGCVTLDPNNTDIVWVGTGENNNQRSVAYGDGVYKSVDGGKNWKKVGLPNSEHIAKIIVHPDNSDVVYVAAMGPLWSAGGDRGVYKTTDGGKTWNAVLSINEHTGIADLVMDPRDPDVLYASAQQRRRHVFTYIGGGPSSGLWKSVDGGASWKEINEGLPTVDLGRIGLEISPANADIIYAVVEAAQGKGGFYRSTTGGESWTRMGNYVSSGNYYQELVADPSDANRVYAMDTWLQVSKDGGKTFTGLGEVTKHVDNHCMWIDPKDVTHIIVGCDGGIYESWDRAATWHYKANLPVTQFYKVSVDQAEPFYNIYGGTQDNFSLRGPARSVSGNGISNDEWMITHGGDGFETQVDPTNPNIIYAQSQYGVLVRFDYQSGEEIDIQPQPRKGENAYRWNWDAPLVISRHDSKRLYFAANKIFRTDDQGNSWKVISEDLTQQINRNTLSVMGKVWSVDAVMKNQSTSPYGTIVAFDESGLDENLLVAGTDDGLIQITSNGGESWKKVTVSGVPSRTYVNMVLTSQHDKNTIYACFNNHKNGDFKPYVYRSRDGGNSWQSITNNLPVRGSSYAIAEDHLDPDLLFVGTEFGVFYSNNGGSSWVQMKGKVPTIAVRDIAIQAREDDLVLGTFGRGFYVLDDYSILRDLKPEKIKDGVLLDVRDAYVFEDRHPLGLPGKSFQGDSYYVGENLRSQALFTYYLKDSISSLTELRRNSEKKSSNNAYPSYEDFVKEKDETKPRLLFTVTNEAGDVVRKLFAEPKAGLYRVRWDLRYASDYPINLKGSSFYNPFSRNEKGISVAPGDYKVSLSKVVDGEVTELVAAKTFKVKSLNNLSIPVDNRDEVVSFKREILTLNRAVESATKTISELETQLKYIDEAINRTELPQGELMGDLTSIQKEVKDLKRKIVSDPEAAKLDYGQPPSIRSRVRFIARGAFNSTVNPAQSYRDSYAIAQEEFRPLLERLRKVVNTDLVNLRNKLKEAGAPFTPYSLPEVPGYQR